MTKTETRFFSNKRNSIIFEADEWMEFCQLDVEAEYMKYLYETEWLKAGCDEVLIKQKNCYVVYTANSAGFNFKIRVSKLRTKSCGEETAESYFSACDTKYGEHYWDGHNYILQEFDAEKEIEFIEMLKEFNTDDPRRADFEIWKVMLDNKESILLKRSPSAFADDHFVKYMEIKENNIPQNYKECEDLYWNVE